MSSFSWTAEQTLKWIGFLAISPQERLSKWKFRLSRKNQESKYQKNFLWGNIKACVQTRIHDHLATQYIQHMRQILYISVYWEKIAHEDLSTHVQHDVYSISFVICIQVTQLEFPDWCREKIVRLHSLTTSVQVFCKHVGRWIQSN